MGGTFEATVGFQDSDFFSESNKNGVEMHFECDFSLFRIQTLTQSHPLLWFSLLSVLQFVVQFATCNTSFEVPVGKAYCVVLKKACAVPFMSDLQSFVCVQPINITLLVALFQKRVKLQKNHYQFIAVANTFR